jgi:hypothetical protein
MTQMRAATFKAQPGNVVMTGLVPVIHAAHIGRPLTYRDARSRCLASLRRSRDGKAPTAWTARQLGRDA